MARNRKPDIHSVQRLADEHGYEVAAHRYKGWVDLFEKGSDKPVINPERGVRGFSLEAAVKWLRGQGQTRGARLKRIL